MSGKAGLKAIRTALDSKDFELAVAKAKTLLEQDPSNYHAYVIANYVHLITFPADRHAG
jgi:superkiller protein 3